MSKFTNAIRMLAKQNALDADATEKLLKAHATEQDGGPGSGNHGHAGRPGKKGGSAPRGGGGGSAGSGGGSSKTPTGGGLKPWTPKPGSVKPTIPKSPTSYSPVKPNGEEYVISPIKPEKPKKPSAKEPKYTPTERKRVGSASNVDDLEKAKPGSVVYSDDGDEFTKQKDGTWKVTNPRAPGQSETVESGDIAMRFEGLSHETDILSPPRKVKSEFANFSNYKIDMNDPAVQKALQKWRDENGFIPKDTDGRRVDWFSDDPKHGFVEFGGNGDKVQAKIFSDQHLGNLGIRYDYKSGVFYGKPDALNSPEGKRLMEQRLRLEGKTDKDLRTASFTFKSPEIKKSLEEWKKTNSDPIDALEDPSMERSSNSSPETTNGGSLTGTSAGTRELNKRGLEKENMEAADWCHEMIDQLPQGTYVGEEQRKLMKNWSETLSQPLHGRPTPEQSKAETEKKLSDISPTLKPYAVERYKKDLANEPQITSDLCDIAEDIGTGMFGLDHRLKGAGLKEVKNAITGETEIDPATGKPKMVCRIQEKIEGDIADAERDGETMTYEQAVDKLSDIVRYTMACTRKNLVSNFEKTKSALEAKGYKVAKIKNTWNRFSFKKPYRGVNCVFVSPTGTRFELQFHTGESVAKKELQHPWYEEQRTKGTSKKRAKELGVIMLKNMKSMKAPVGIEKIKNYP